MQIITVTPTITASSAYAAGNLIGGKNTLLNVLPGGQVGTLRGVSLIDKSNQKSAIDLAFFAADFAGTTFTDKAALAIPTADLVNGLGSVSILTSDYISFSANAIATKGGLAVVLIGSQTLYMALVCRGTPTYAGTTDLVVKLFIDA